MLKSTKRSAVLTLLGALFLSACGGGNEQTGATDLYGAYDVIEGGMSEVQVKAVIGAEPQRRQADGDKAHILTWETDANTYRHTTLLVTLHDEDGVTRKIVTGYRGNQSQSF
ncbi:hypothetical protein KIH07_23540 [Hydrogenophaga taeniospiralis]|uniref:hypothetical protein n=1 Tax=Hydrogenophaga taeniospiralis TaxID=65656 RepID=UPI001CFA933D|nr:hypothetical protein [Hydrogenophaga taeniospiralis]MCB4366720.1 hypothetical protein [Hydrogenophaga taeniospiralis]